MTDIFNIQKWRGIMVLVKSKNKQPVLVLNGMITPFWSRCRCRKHHPTLPAKPDLVFSRTKLPVFVDGGLWHGNQYAEKSTYLSSMWKNKIEGNLQRDRNVETILSDMGYRILCFWDDVIRKNSERVFIKIAESLITTLSNKS